MWTTLLTRTVRRPQDTTLVSSPLAQPSLSSGVIDKGPKAHPVAQSTGVNGAKSRLEAETDASISITAGCVLCDVLAGSPTVPFRQLFRPQEFRSERILDDHRFVVVADVAPLGAGHVLILPFEHISAIASMNPADCAQIDKLRSIINEVVQFRTGMPSIAFEHGLCRPDIAAEGCGINHAHLHVLPYPGDVRGALTSQYECTQLSSLGALVDVATEDTQEYLLLIDHRGRHVFADLAAPARQFFRRVISDLRSYDLWNWHDQVLLGDVEKRRHLIAETRSMYAGLTMLHDRPQANGLQPVLDGG